MLRMWVIALVVGTASASALAQQSPDALLPGQYGPVFAESGFREDGHYFDLGFDASVNHYGGNLIVSATDVSIPSQGLFSLSFGRTYNSHKNMTWTMSVLTESDSPLGLGWTGHYGVLHWSGSNPQYIDSSGARHIFYRHNHLNGSIPLGQWISSSLAVLTAGSIVVNLPNGMTRSETIYELREPNGLVTTFTRPIDTSNTTYPHIYAFYVPTEIRDVHGNRWTISYIGFHDRRYSDQPLDDPAGYYLHPLVDRIRDDHGRELVFEYTFVPGDLTNRPRLGSITFDGVALSTYSYRTSSTGQGVYLYSQTTGEGRTTTYTTEDLPATGVLSRLRTITGRTGGGITFDYSLVFIDYPFWGGVPQPVYAVTGMDRDGRYWSYGYSPDGQNRHKVEVRCRLSNNHVEFRGTYRYYTYGQNVVANAIKGWKIGQLLESTETFNGTTTTKTVQYDDNNPFQISLDLYGNRLTAVVSVPRLVSESSTQDGTTLTTTYLDYDGYNASRRIETSGNGPKRWFTYHHVAESSGPYLLGTRASEKVTFVDDNWTMQETTYRFPQGSLLPDRQSVKRTGTDTIHVSLEFWGTAGKAGALKKKTSGSYWEQYDYEYGVLKSIDYSDGPDMTRTLNRNGTVATETANGVQRTFPEWDLEFRPKRVTAPATDDIVISYLPVSVQPNVVTVTQGTSEKVLIYDAWGRLAQRKEKIETQQWAVARFWGFDPFDRVVSETTRTGAQYALYYDVHGRLLYRKLTNESATVFDRHDYVYRTDPDGSVTTTHYQNGTVQEGVETVTQNGETIRVAPTVTHQSDCVIRTKKVDPLGRIVRGSTGRGGDQNRTEHFVDYQYHYDGGSTPVRQEIQPQNQANSTRTVWFDLLGNKVKERHPETGTIEYGFSAEGWLQSVDRPGQDHFYVRDARGRVTQMRNGLDVTGALLATTTYDGQYGFVASSKNVYDDVEVTYSDPDDAGRPQKMTHKIPAAIPAPVMITPAGQWQVLGPLTNVFEWQPVTLPGGTAADRYKLEIYEVWSSSNPQYTLIDTEFSTLTYFRFSRLPTAVQATLARGGTFGVRVRVHTTDGRIGPFSGMTHFAFSAQGSPILTPSPLMAYSGSEPPMSREATHRVYETRIHYDGQGKVIDVQPASFVRELTPNALSPLSVPAGNRRQYAYNAAGSQKTLDVGLWHVVSATEFENSGLTKKITLPLMNDSFISRGEDAIVDRTYDTLGRPASMTVSSGSPSRSLYEMNNVQYDPWGFVSSFVRNDNRLRATVSYGYTTSGQLETFTVGAYADTYRYDDQGNLVSKQGDIRGCRNTWCFSDPAPATTYDTDNRCASWTYDADGRIVGDDQGQYGYTPVGHLSQCTPLNFSWSGPTGQFLYDAEGRRVREVHQDKVVYSLYLPDGRLMMKDTFFQELPVDAYRTVTVTGDKATSEGSDTTVLSDPMDSVKNPTGKVFIPPTLKGVRHDLVYFQGSPILTVVAYAGSPNCRLVYEFRDLLGSPAITLAPVAGYGLGERCSYFAPYGNEMLGNRDDFTLLQFTGHQREEHLGDAGDYYMLARHYNATLGRFRQPDPAFDFDELNPASYNLYEYARGNPVHYTDPSGRVVHVAVIAAASAEAASTAYDITDFAMTVSDPNAPSIDVLLSGVGLAAGTVLPLGGYGKVAKIAREALEKSKLRSQARKILTEILGDGPWRLDLEIHHRIPLEWRKLFPDLDPNRLENLQALPYDVHRMVNSHWKHFKKIMRDGKAVTAEAVDAMAKRLDELYGKFDAKGAVTK